MMKKIMKKKRFFQKRLAGIVMAALIGGIGIVAATLLGATRMVGLGAVANTQTVDPGKGSIMLDTASYTMAPGDRYTIGTYLKGADGKEMDAAQVRALTRANVLSVRDSRTGSVVNLSQQSNGNFVVTGKYEGTCYIIYEIGGTHASVQVNVKKGAKAGGNAVRNTSYFTQDLPEIKVPKGPMIALTFDDGPNGKVTQQIVNTLKANDAKATFFMVGNRISSDKETVRMVYESGSEIASHSYDHSSLTGLSAAGVRQQVQQTQNLVRSVVPFTPMLLRPPYGAYNASVQNSASMPLILWSIDTLDWQHRNSARTIQTVLSSVKEGDIILMHDLQPSTAAACKTLIPELKKRGFQLVTVSELIEARTGKPAVAGKVYRNGY